MNPEESMRAKRSASTHDDALGSSSTKVASIVAVIGGWALGIYTGFNLLVPLVATAFAWLAGRRLFGKKKQMLVAPFCVQAGHLVWIVVGTLMTRELLGLNLIQIACLASGLVWLCVRPGKAPLCMLAVYQLLALPYNVLQFSATDLGSVSNKVLLVHIVWRCLALFYMARLYYRMSRPDPGKQAKPS